MSTAIITGASGNLGQAVVEKFLANGFHVTGTANSGNDLPFSRHKDFISVKVDLSNEEAAQAFVQAVIAEQQQIDVAVLTVGGFAVGKIADTSTKDILDQYKLNFETAYNVARPVFAQMIKQGRGRIFLIGSRPGLSMHNSKGMVAYGLSKSLIFELAELLNDEAKGQDIVTSVIVPGTIDTPQNRLSMPDADFSKWAKPSAIADIIFFNSTAEASLLRESIIKVYGNS